MTATLLLALLAAQAPPAETRWLAEGADIAAFLAQAPGECLRSPAGEEERYLIEVGRGAFRNPLLFGGPAARGGLSCNSCHRDGRDNPDFFLKGLSDRPGTVDVTSSLFSRTRDDGMFNPLPIPSLVGVAGKTAFGERAKAPSLHAFIEGAVTDEFQGVAPPPPVLDGLVAYVAALDPEACPDAPISVSLARAVASLERTLAVAESAVARGDGSTADFLLLAAQRELGLVSERFAGDAPAQARIETLAREIGALREVVDEATGAPIAEKREELAEFEAFLQGRVAGSLYDAATIRERFAPSP